jgi:hypothetical protein
MAIKIFYFDGERHVLTLCDFCGNANSNTHNTYTVCSKRVLGFEFPKFFHEKCVPQAFVGDAPASGGFSEDVQREHHVREQS